MRDQKLAGAAEVVSAGTNIYEFKSGAKLWLDSFEPSELSPPSSDGAARRGGIQRPRHSGGRLALKAAWNSA
ncbi:hypothetical protein GCM10010470_04020 [Saccharopolyspora taberi]|uniref:Uncharacterized protein n=1 Tax=Saccharopolyspora taberi TaxID=60895 RepID=A0ABN3V2E4_9PSEU